MTNLEIGQHWRTDSGIFTRTILDIGPHPLGGSAVWWADHCGTGMCRRGIFKNWIAKKRAHLVPEGETPIKLWGDPDRILAPTEGGAAS